MLTLDQARAVLWPFTHPKRPIGELLDEGAIGAPDLQRAARVAYSRRVKSACATMLETLTRPVLPPLAVPPLTVLPRAASPPAYPLLCPICGARTQSDPRWDSAKHGAGWRCETDGATHCLQLRYLAKLKAVFAPDAYVIPPSDDYPGVRRCELAHGPIGYLPEANH
jgi:hypothetical protein